MSTQTERVIDFRIFKNIVLQQQNVPAGEVLIAIGSMETKMYIVKSGLLAVKVADKIVEQVGPGQVVGEMSLIDNGPRSAEVFALQNSVVIPIDEPRFLNLVVKVPHFALLLMRLMARRLRSMNTKL